MDVHQINAFLAVAEELHFGRAAERLHIAQPPLTRTIKQLERDLGSELFARTTRKVQLTSAGKALVGPARQVLEHLADARRAVEAAGRGETGRIRIGFAGPSSHFMVGALGRRVRERQPGIELSLQNTTYAHEAIRSVLDGELDLAIARWDIEPMGLSNRILSVEHYVIVVPEGHALARRRRIAMSECVDASFVALPPDPGSTVRDALIRTARDAGFVPRIVQVAPDTWTALALVAAGVGITFAIDAAVENVKQQGIVTIPLEEGRRPTFSRLVWRCDDHAPALREVLKASEEALPTPPDIDADGSTAL